MTTLQELQEIEERKAQRGRIHALQIKVFKQEFLENRPWHRSSKKSTAGEGPERAIHDSKCNSMTRIPLNNRVHPLVHSHRTAYTDAWIDLVVEAVNAYQIGED